MFQGREPGGLDPLGPDDNVRRIRFHTDIQRKNDLASPLLAFLVGIVFIVFGVWMLLGAPDYLGLALVSLGIGLFFSCATGILLWSKAHYWRSTHGDR
jgi:hypothetical protein